MSTVRAKTTAKTFRRIAPHAGVTLPHPSHRPPAPAYVLRNNRPTHVLLPIDEYERLLAAVEAHELGSKLEDRATKWVKADDVARGIASSWIAQARKRAGLTQKQLADRLGMPQPQISRIERNPDHTTVRTMQRIAEALGLDLGAILSYAARRR